MRLLFAEDDRELSKAVQTLLTRSGYTVDAVYNGEDALDYARGGGYDGLILDWMMPRVSGVEVLKRLRQEGIDLPCLMMTARDAVEDRVKGLDAGADDYLPKPFATSELLARVRAMLRRKAAYVPDIIRCGDLALDKGGMTLACGKNSVLLGNKPFQLMEMLMEHPRQVLTITQMMDQVWGWDAEVETGVVWVNISFLRKKLTEIGSKTEIRVSRGAGYSLECEA